MARKLPILRVAGPTLLVSLLLFAACTLSAVVLYRFHASTAEGLAEDIESRKKAVEIETTLRNLISLVRKGSDQVDALNETIEQLIEESVPLANTDEEMLLHTKLQASFGRYHHDVWANRSGGEAQPAGDAVKAGLRILEKEALPTVVALRNLNSRQIEDAEHELKRTVKGFAWGLVAVGCIGSFGGTLLGYGVARALRHSIYRLSVNIRDAADKLGYDLPTVTITHGDGIDYLHAQMQGLQREIEQTVERLHQREREVLRAEQMAAVGQLAAGVAHELRNPLTAVKLLVETSREDLEARGLPAEDLAIIGQEVGRLERSLQSFLDFARPPRMERRRLDLAAVIGEALALVGGRARKQKVVVRFTPPEPAVWLEADGSQLRQLVVNVAMNALDAMPQGGTLAVTVQRLRLEHPYVEVHVQDTGPGIAEGLLPRLFQPFVSGKETGLGLGLVVSRRIAQAHGGHLWAMNQLQGGACLILRLPLPAAPETRRAKSEIRNPKSEANPKSGIPNPNPVRGRYSFQISDFRFVSDFGFRISDLLRVSDFPRRG
jgi:signal transduction histidine kinase